MSEFNITVVQVKPELTPEMMVWLCECPNWRTWHIHPWYLDVDDRGADVFFDHPEDATAFKLTFAI